MNITMDWHAANKIADDHTDLPVKQVYAWLISDDNRVVIVSKDGVSWQLPGGKPNSQESLDAALGREIQEETSLDIKQLELQPKLFGYYVVTLEEESDNRKQRFLQLRYLCNLPEKFDRYTIQPNEADDTQPDSDKVNYVEFCDLKKLADKISWMPDSGEWQHLTSHNLIK